MHVDKQEDSDIDDLITIGFTGFFFFFANQCHIDQALHKRY